MPNSELPRERLLHCGPESLTNAELLAVLLRTGTAGHSALEVGRLILSGGDSLLTLHALSMEELRRVPGIGEVKAAQILALLEFAKRLAKETAAERLSFTSPDTVARCYMEQLRHEVTERVLLLLLDGRLSLLTEKVLSVGTVHASLISPREVYRIALRGGASYVMLLHNHPSGDPTPSREDIAVTRRVRDAGSTVGIPLADHLVIGDACFVSMRERGLL